MRVLLVLLVLLASPAFAEGELTPIAGNGTPFSQIHFFPKNGNKIVISGVRRTIPPGVGVMSGGVIGTYDNASIDKTPARKLAPKTLYYVYVYMRQKVMTMDFSQEGHKEDPTYGNEVHASDPSRSLVGMVYTDDSGKFVGDSRSQLVLSWFNRGHTGLIQQIGPEYGKSDSCTPNMTDVAPHIKLEWLQWGINNKFRQGFTVPNVYVTGTVRNTEPGGHVYVSIALNGIQASFKASYYQAERNSLGNVHVVIVGANGTDEGYNKATLLMGAGGKGCAVMDSGAIYSSPLES